jgi:adenylate cyclase
LVVPIDRKSASFASIEGSDEDRKFLTERFCIDHFVSPLSLRPVSHPFQHSTSGRRIAFIDDGRARILVVDDDLKLQSVVKKVAEAVGFEVLQAFDGPPGLVLASTENVDLILLDINMPAMDGRDVLRRQKANPSTADIPVLVYSGRDSQQDRLVAFELGAEDYNDKPFDSGALLKKIGRLIEKEAVSARQDPER